MKHPMAMILTALGLIGSVFIAPALVSIVGLLLYRGGDTINLSLLFGDVSPWAAISGQKPVWDGLWPACLGTVSLVGLTLVLVLPPGLGCGIFLAEFASPRQRELIGTAMDMAAGVPSIVMGLFGFTLILALRQIFPQANTCLLLAAFCLSLLVLPALVTATREAVNAVPQELRLTMAALGFSKSQSLYRVVLPAAGQGILSGVILALGRAAEDAAVIMLTGVVANAGLPAGLTSKFEALPFRIYYTAAQYADQGELAAGFGAALVLLMLSGGLLFCAWLLQRGLEREWRGLK